MKQEIEIEPLTKKARSGQLYERHAEVEAQIKEALHLSAGDLFDRLSVTDFNSADHVKNESLAFLIRYHRTLGEDGMVDRLAKILVKRLRGKINKRVQFLPVNLRSECFDEIVTNVVTPIADLTDDRSDYAQVNFGPWFNGRAISALRKYFVTAKADQRTDSLTTGDGDEAEVSETVEFRVGEILPEEHSVLLREALGQLSETERTAFLLKHYWRWEIEKKDNSVPTISRYLGVTSRTVRNWLDGAEKKLAKWRGERR